MKKTLYTNILLLFFCLANAQKFPLMKNGKFDSEKFESLKVKETKEYSVSIQDQEPNCKKIIMKNDRSVFYYCGPFDKKIAREKAEYSEAREFTESIDGFQCIVNEYYTYDYLGRVTEFRKYLSKIPALTNLTIESFPLEEKRYENGKLVSERKTVFHQKIHNVLIATIILYNRERLGMQGSDQVSISNYDNSKVTFKNNTVQLDKKGANDPEISRNEIIKAFTSLKRGFSMYRSINTTPEDNPDEWVIFFTKDGKEYTISIEDETGRGFSTRKEPRDIREVI